MNWIKFKIKEYGWKAILASVTLVLVAYYFYLLIKPGVNRSEIVDRIVTDMKVAAKENQIRAELEKDKIGAIKNIYTRKLNLTTEITDRQKRLEALSQLYKELDF